MSRTGAGAYQVRRYILTGTPGAGKTTILRELRARGWAVVDEAATDVIAREQARGVDEPWTHAEFLSFIVPSAARRISYRDALKFEEVHEAVYQAHGFDMVDVPASEVEQRVALIEAVTRRRSGVGR